MNKKTGAVRNRLHVKSCRNKTLVHRRDAKNADITKGNNNCCASPYNEYFYSCPEDSFA